MARTMHTDELPDCDYRLHPGDCVWYNDGEFMIADELGRLSTMRVQKFVLDLFALQKFMGSAVNWEERYAFAPRTKRRMYDFDWVPVARSPEKSQIDKALEDFVAKRKAKRGSNNGHDWPTESGLLFSQRKCRKCGLNGADIRSADVCDGAKAVKRCDALGDAMRRLSFHEQDIHTRLMPYRREE